MVTAAAEHNTFQKILPLLLMRLGKAAYSFLHLIEQRLVYDCRVVVRNDVPLRPVLKAAVVSADLKDCPLPNDVGASIFCKGLQKELWYRSMSVRSYLCFFNAAQW